MVNYLQLHVKILSRLCQQLGIISILIFFLLAIFLYVVSKLSPIEIITIAFSLILSLHIKRGDKRIVKEIYRKKTKWLFCIDYLIILIPFSITCILKDSLLTAILCLLLAFIPSFFPNWHIHLKLFTHPLLLKGSYEYQNSLRILIVPYILCICASFIGLVYENNKIFLVSVLTFIYLLGITLFQKPEKQHLLLYKSANRIIFNKLKYSVGNSIVLLSPFLIISLFYQPNYFFSCIILLLISIIFLFEANCLRYIYIGNDFISIILLTTLFSVNVAALKYLSIIVISCIISLIFIKYIQLKYKDFYDRVETH